MTYQAQVLVIEDDRDLAELSRIHLQDIGCEVSLCYDGFSGFSTYQSGHFDLLILDLNLPLLDGLEVCKKIRRQDEFLPILMLTSRDGENDRVLGLELGADDYLTKPFHIRELQARVKALLRRSKLIQPSSDEDCNMIKLGPLHINPDKHEASLHHSFLELTATEFDLLFYLAQHPDQVFTRSQLLNAVWGYGHAYEHTVNSHINRLRAKIEPIPAKPILIKTVWGIGYKFSKTGLNDV